MKMYVYLLLVCIATSCTSVKLAIPAAFSSQATRMRIKGLHGWSINQKLSFGNYHTSKVKRGWGVSTKTAEERILKVFSVESTRNKTDQKGKFHFDITNDNLTATAYCQEQLFREGLGLKTNISWLDGFSKTLYTEYSFCASILPQQKSEAPWELTMYSVYDIAKDTARKLFDLPYKAEKGFATNGKDTITIEPIRVQHFTTKTGRNVDAPVKFLAAYELRIEGGVVAVIDTFDSDIWLFNDLDEPTKFLLSAIASALVLRTLQQG